METQTIRVFTNLILLVFLLVFLAATTSTGSTIYGLSLTIALILCFLKSFGGLVADKRPPSFPSRCRYVVISNHPGLTAQVTSAHPPALHLMPQLMNRWPKTLKLFPIHPSIHSLYIHPSHHVPTHPTTIFSPTIHPPTTPPSHLSTHPTLMKRATGSSLGVTATFGARWIFPVWPFSFTFCSPRPQYDWKNWEKAEALCVEKGAHLASIPDQVDSPHI